MISRRHDLLTWAAQGLIAPERFTRALRIAGVIPSRAGWRRFLDHLTLWLGAALLAAGLVFFIAHNWQAWGRLARFALAEGALLLALAGIWRFGVKGPAGKASLTCACLALGALLALVGIVYQTGADTFELFAAWAALMLPWVLLGRFAPLWLIWIAVLNTAVGFYFETGLLRWKNDAYLWTMCALLMLQLAAWEAAALWRKVDWLKARYGARLLALAGAAVLTRLACEQASNFRFFDHAVFDHDFALPVWGGWLVALWLTYRKWTTDLFMLAVGVFSLVSVVFALMLANLPRRGLLGPPEFWLIYGLVLVGLSAAGGVWLKRVAVKTGKTRAAGDAS
jgi:uncharacterized membrane protein